MTRESILIPILFDEKSVLKTSVYKSYNKHWQSSVWFTSFAVDASLLLPSMTWKGLGSWDVVVSTKRQAVHRLSLRSLFPLFSGCQLWCKSSVFWFPLVFWTSWHNIGSIIVKLQKNNQVIVLVSRFSTRHQFWVIWSNTMAVLSWQRSTASFLIQLDFFCLKYIDLETLLVLLKRFTPF